MLLSNLPAHDAGADGGAEGRRRGMEEGELYLVVSSLLNRDSHV